jgi:hypothetical protein
MPFADSLLKPGIGSTGVKEHGASARMQGISQQLTLETMYEVIDSLYKTGSLNEPGV